MSNTAAKFEDLSDERLEELGIIALPYDPEDPLTDYVFTQDLFVHKDRIRIPPGTNAVVIIPE